MPALPVAPSVIRLVTQFAIENDQDAISKLHFLYTGSAPTAAQLITFCGVMNTSWNANLKGLCGDETYLVGNTATDLTSSTSAEGTAADSIQGTRGTSYLPADTAFVASYEIVRRYRGGHPRGYWPFGIDTDILDPQHWESASVTAFLAGVEAYIASAVGGGWSGAGTISQVNVSYFEGFTAVENPITHRYRNVPNVRAAVVIDEITSVIGRQRPGSQRRRLGKS